MEEHTFESALSTHNETSITVREKDLGEEVMGELSFPAALYYLWTGTEPTAGEQRVIDAMLTSLMVHGITPSAIATRMTAMAEPDTLQAAVASGVLGVGSRFVGSMKECAADLQAIADSEDTATAGEELVESYLERGDRFPGIGHPHLDPTDPRAERLFELAREEGVAGEHVEHLEEVRDTFEAETGRHLPINVTGAIAALASDLGLSPDAARGLAVVSRATGSVGEVLEEKRQPIAGDVWQLVDGNATRPDDR